jgi:hypothetical protein
MPTPPTPVRLSKVKSKSSPKLPPGFANVPPLALTTKELSVPPLSSSSRPEPLVQLQYGLEQELEWLKKQIQHLGL